MLRCLFYMQHKEELENDEINIFNDEKKYLEILEKYIRRGLYEMYCSWKNKDCFYQWCLDNLHLKSYSPIINQIQSSDYFSKIQQYFRKFGIDIHKISEKESYRHHICKISILDSSRLPIFDSKHKFLSNSLGIASIATYPCEGIENGYNIAIPKPPNKWQMLGVREFNIGKRGLKNIHNYDRYDLGIFAGLDSEGEAISFDLATAPHLFVAGTTGSGKTALLRQIITALLTTQPKNNIKIIL